MVNKLPAAPTPHRDAQVEHCAFSMSDSIDNPSLHLAALLHRRRTKDDPHGEQADPALAKCRDRELRRIRLHFDGQFQRFTEAAQ